MISVELTKEQYVAIATYLSDYLDFTPYEKLKNNGWSVEKYYKAICSGGLRHLIREKVIDIKEMSLNILDTFNILIPPNILFELASELV